MPAPNTTGSHRNQRSCSASSWRASQAIGATPRGSARRAACPTAGPTRAIASPVSRRRRPHPAIPARGGSARQDDNAIRSRRLRSALPATLPSTLAHVSRRPTVRLNTGRPGVSPRSRRNSPAARTARVQSALSPAAGRLELGVGQHLERVRIEIGGEVGGVGIGAREQRIVEPHLGRHRVRRRHPVQRRLHLAPVGRRVAAARRGIVGAAQLDHLARRILHRLAAGHEIGVAQPHLLAGRKPVELLRRILHEVVALDVELAAEADLSRARRRGPPGC